MRNVGRSFFTSIFTRGLPYYANDNYYLPMENNLWLGHGPSHN